MMMNPNEDVLFDGLDLDVALAPVSPTPSSSSTGSLAESVSAAAPPPPRDLLSASLSESGLLANDNMTMNPWDGDTDAFLDSILTGNPSDVENLALGGMETAVDVGDVPMSDTSSDSGCNLDQIVSAQSPEVMFVNDARSDEDDEPLQAVNPMTNSPPECTMITIPRTSLSAMPKTTLQTSNNIKVVLPMHKTTTQKKLICTTAQPVSKRRRVSASSSDSGLDEMSHTTTIYTTDDSCSVASLSPTPGATRTRTTITTLGTPQTTHINLGTAQTATTTAATTTSSTGQKYPQLILNEEEKRLCEREGIKLPSHYPLSREEEKNLKRIRRKIRNKVSAQDSRKRKKEYVDAMEDRVRICSEENEELQKKMELLESQNKTLAGQVKRLHQIIVNGGLLKNTQTSTAMMVLLLSTALFLLPGFKNDGSDSKCELDITQAIKMPPMPGQSRSLLQFAPTGIKQEYPASPEQAMPQNVVVAKATDALATAKDHDYTITKTEPTTEFVPSAASPKSVLLVGGGNGMKMEDPGLNSYIEEDAPPQGYGPGKIMVEERRINVTRGGARQGMRTVVLHVPKDIK